MGDPWKIDDTGDAVPWKIDDTKREPNPTLKRFVTGVADPAYGLAQMAGIDDEGTRQREQAYSPPEGTDWARLAGNVVSPVNLLAAPFQAGKRLVSAAAGAVSGAAQPSEKTGADYWLDKGKEAAIGAGLGFVLPGLPKSKEAATLMQKGIQPTAGQAAGGWVDKVEQALQSVPIVGTSVENARRRPINEFGEKVIERATGQAGIKSIDEANAAVSNMYQAVAPHLPQHQLQPQFYADFQRALQNPELTPVNQKLLYDLTGNRFANYEKLSGDQLKTLDSDIGTLMRKYAKSTDVSHHAIADGLQEIQQGMRATWESLLPPNLRGKLQDANKAFAQMVPVNKAASQRADEVVMPRALQKTMARQAGRDVTRMPPDALVDSAAKVLPPNLGDSGTAGRLLATDMDTLIKAAFAKIPAEILMSRAGQRLVTGNTPMQNRLGPISSAMASAALRERKKRGEE